MTDLGYPTRHQSKVRALHETTKGLSLALSSAADRDDQGRLYDDCFKKSDGRAVIGWRYDGNPHGEALAMLARNEAGLLVSSYACQPRRVFGRGDPQRACTIGQTGDVMTHPDWRKLGVFADLNWAAMDEARRRGWPVAWGLPNANSGHLFFGKLDWQLAGHIGPWTFVLAADAHARRERMRAGRLASAIVPWSYWRGSMTRGRLRELSWSKVTAAPIERFTPEVDEISKEVETRHDFMVRRDAAYLNWRYFDAPSGLFRAHGVYDGAGALRGYVVLQMPRPGEMVGFVVDILALDDVALAAAMDTALGHLQAAGASVARAYAMKLSWWEQQLARCGFRAPKRNGYKEVGAYPILPEHPMTPAGMCTARWYFTDGDRDDETVR